MRRLRDLSIRNRLILLAVTSVTVALLLACVAVVINDIHLIRQSKVEQLDAQARMLSFNCTGVLTFHDGEAAEQLLASLAMQPSVEFASLMDADGELLATYQSQAGTNFTPPPKATDGHRFTRSGYLELHQTVFDSGENVGTLFLRANLRDFHSQLADQCQTIAVAMACALAVSVALSYVLQRAISRPILKLSRTAESITSHRDYSIRVEHDSSNELGNLCDAFNRMLDEVETSKRALHEANDQLERRVEERTEQLTSEIQKKERVQADLVRAKDAAEAANRAKSEFLANMSHEIRTPLNGVLGFADLLLRGADKGDERLRLEYLETVKSSGEHLLTLLNDILDISKIEAGRLNVESVRCAPHGLIAQVISLLRPQAQQKGLELDCEWATDMPEFILTDAARFRQLLMNLLGNAVKFTEQGRVRVVARLDEPDNQLKVDVVDTGIGISSDKLAEIFDPFRQADNSVTRRFGGTGLGLAISHHLALALGGNLSVTSEVGKGSTFTMSVSTGPLDGVPRHAPSEADALLQEEPTAVFGPCHLSQTRILVVEDGPTNRKLIKAILEQAGADVACAENGQIGVERARQNAYDAILMDMQMPVMDGYAATRHLRDLGYDPPIIALTAHAMKGDEVKCREAGCSGYLTKPIDTEQLLACLAAALPEKTTRDGDVLAAVTTGRDGPDSAGTDATGRGDRLASRLDMSQPVFRELVGEFVEFVRKQLDEMRRALSERDFHQLATLAHSIKGSGGTAGFDEFTEPSREVERCAAREDVEQVGHLLDQLTELTDLIVIPDEVRV